MSALVTPSTGQPMRSSSSSGFSLMCCLADGLSHDHAVGTGTVMRPATLEKYAVEAGFGGIEILPSTTTSSASTACPSELNLRNRPAPRARRSALGVPARPGMHVCVDPLVDGSCDAIEPHRCCRADSRQDACRTLDDRHGPHPPAKGRFRCTCGAPEASIQPANALPDDRWSVPVDFQVESLEERLLVKGAE